MTVNRQELLNRLIRAKHNGFVKIITGIRRCGKSYLLFNLFRNHLLESGADDDHIIAIDLEKADDDTLLNPINLRKHIQARIKNDGKWTYVLLDEIQTCSTVLREGVDLARLHPEDVPQAYITFYKTLSALRTMPNVDVYVTGSNSRLLSSDVATEFRGRGQVIHITPLSFGEFFQLHRNTSNPYAVLNEYLSYGGLPECALFETHQEKESYLNGLYQTIYIRDVVERMKLRGEQPLASVIDVAMSNIGSLTNPTKLANALKTRGGITATKDTISKYLGYLENAFILSKATRFDVRGNHYLDYPAKYYAADTGLRNARTGFRQMEFTHLMENAIYNELKRQGYTVDVGVVYHDTTKAGKHVRSSHEIDFVVNRGYERIYIQSAWMIPDAEKMAQETFSLKHTGDNFRKVVIDGSPMAIKHIDNDGIGHIGLLDFLLDPKSIETL